jgi:hypothetical protein
MVRVQDLIPTARGVIHGRTSLPIPGRLLNSPVTDDGHPEQTRYCPRGATGVDPQTVLGSLLITIVASSLDLRFFGVGRRQ